MIERTLGHGRTWRNEPWKWAVDLQYPPTWHFESLMCRVMRETGANLGIPVYVFGPETHMTAVVGMALGTRAIPKDPVVEFSTANFLLPGGQSGEVYPSRLLLITLALSNDYRWVFLEVCRKKMHFFTLSDMNRRQLWCIFRLQLNFGIILNDRVDSHLN